MPHINCEKKFILTWSASSVVTNSTGAGTFAITDTKLYVLAVTLSTQDNTTTATNEIRTQTHNKLE